MSKRVARQGGINYTLLMAGGLSENGKKLLRLLLRG